MRTRRRFGGDLGQVQVHCLDVAMGKGECGALAFLGANGAEDVCRCRALIERRRCPCSAFCPTARDLVLAADARFDGEPDLYRARIDAFLARDFVQTPREFSLLKSSIAPLAWA